MFGNSKPDGSNESRDAATALTMLHNTLMQSTKELREVLASELKKVQDSNESMQQHNTKAVNDELSRFRGDLRDARNSLVTSRDTLGHEVRSGIVDLRREVQQLAEVIQAQQDLSAKPALSSEPSISPDVVRPATPGAVLPAQSEPQAGETVAVADPPAEVAAPATAHGPQRVEDTDQSQRQGGAQAYSPASASDPVEDTGTLHNDLDGIRLELEGLRAQTEEHGEAVAEAIASIRDYLQAALRPSLPSVAAEEADVEHDRAAHRGLLRKAAGLSCALLVCHRDCWEFVTGMAGRHPHFRMPSQITDHGEDRIAAAVSGRSLIAVLISLQQIRDLGETDEADCALSDAIYERISAGLTALAPSGGTVTITLDDRTPTGEDTVDTPTPGTDHADSGETVQP